MVRTQLGKWNQNFPILGSYNGKSDDHISLTYFDESFKFFSHLTVVVDLIPLQIKFDERR